jgi:hypothetical protein
MHQPHIHDRRRHAYLRLLHCIRRSGNDAADVMALRDCAARGAVVMIRTLRVRLPWERLDLEH